MKVTNKEELRTNMKDIGFSYVDYTKITEYAKLFKVKSIDIKENNKSIYNRLYNQKDK